MSITTTADYYTGVLPTLINAATAGVINLVLSFPPFEGQAG